MEFDRDDMGYRRLLALSIRDYINRPKKVRDGQKGISNNTLDKLAEEMGSEGMGVSRSTLVRLQHPEPKDELGTSYPKQAKHVASYLHDIGLYPPGQDIANTLKILPIFFGGFLGVARDALQGIYGEYDCYQFSNRKPNHIISGKMKIYPPNEWRFSQVEEEYEYREEDVNYLKYSGAAISDDEKNIYMLMREEEYKYPRFYLFDDIRRDRDRNVKAINGMVLSGARYNKRHLSPVVLYRGPEKAPDNLIPVDEIETKAPKVVAHHLTRSLSPGSG